MIAIAMEHEGQVFDKCARSKKKSECVRNERVVDHS